MVSKINDLLQHLEYAKISEQQAIVLSINSLKLRDVTLIIKLLGLKFVDYCLK